MFHCSSICINCSLLYFCLYVCIKLLYLCTHPLGRGKNSHAYTHTVQMDHRVWLNLHSLKFYCLPDNYEIIDPSLEDIKVYCMCAYRPHSVYYNGWTSVKIRANQLRGCPKSFMVSHNGCLCQLQTYRRHGFLSACAYCKISKKVCA